jgi:hypothetical protein
MVYRVTGKFAGRKVEIEWSSMRTPHLHGDDMFIAILQASADIDLPVSLPGLGGGTLNLDDPNLVACAANHLCDDGIGSWAGDTLKWEDESKPGEEVDY